MAQCATTERELSVDKSDFLVGGVVVAWRAVLRGHGLSAVLTGTHRSLVSTGASSFEEALSCGTNPQPIFDLSLLSLQNASAEDEENVLCASLAELLAKTDLA